MRDGCVGGGSAGDAYFGSAADSGESSSSPAFAQEGLADVRFVRCSSNPKRSRRVWYK